jgi:hypothetical protein
MDLAEKLAILKRYDFSQNGHGAYKGWGWSNNIGAIILYADMMMTQPNPSGSEKQAYQALPIFTAYGCIRAQFDRVDFMELDESDPDFGSFYAIRESLPILGNAIMQYVSDPRDATFQELQAAANRLYGLSNPAYVKRISELESLLDGHNGHDGYR